MANNNLLLGAQYADALLASFLAAARELFVDGDGVYAYGDISLSNSWVAHDAANWATPGAGLGPNGHVVLRGLIKDGTATGGTVVGVLPSGRRPPYSLMFHAAAPNSDGADLVLSPDGNITLFNAVTCSFLSLSGISFTV